MTVQINNRTFIIELFFNHNGIETFQDKLLRIILSRKNGVNDYCVKLHAE